MSRCEEQVMISTDHATQDDQEHAPPDGGYGWICVIACFIINCFTFGLVSVGSLSKLLNELLN